MLRAGAGSGAFENVQTAFWPSSRLIVAVRVPTSVAGVPSPVHPIVLRSHPATVLSVTVYVWKSVIPVKAFVSLFEPSSTSEKFVSGAGDAVNGKLLLPSGV